ncbi:glycogen operon protein GlgX homolog [Rhodococcoides trifolii]|uniref:Glycogen operon protein GlgX homolog n=1 Tax=Rhodococcoides trifolii TaxID=908250 RepID=A0A917FVU0_9NOCA|nr:glycogen debranching protein GlgX [Rhodococcus trifolii]GGG06067.1 glycogen operon protein GlgX homolog [Rhodococcus trifolii]
MSDDLATEPGSPFPLGATVGARGVNFAVHAPDAEGVELCLVDGSTETRVALTERTYGIWHGAVSVPAGQQYGYRVSGPWDPSNGYRFNPHKLLVDPSARQVTGDFGDAHALLAFADDPFGRPSTVDSLGHVPLAVVTASEPADGVRLETPWDHTVIYELHVGSFTGAHPDVPEHLRGTYLALAEPVVLEHLVSLGVTAVELLPVQACFTEPGVRARGMRNHWGYSTGSYFAPETSYASEPGNERAEFRAMVAALHAAGIEVILDVVYNHTCEGGVDGPSISWRGFDARGYYLLNSRGQDIDLTGCGNTLDAASPAVVRMVCDSLRFWVTEMGVDGFRFDLASTLGRPGGYGFDPRAPLLTAIASDPVLCRAKLIAEPWDATGPGYQVGGFGPVWSEWNDRYRDTARRFWAGQTGVRELASRMAGSEDIYGGSGRRPWSSINFVTAHDGFTARDLVSYRHKHNERNGEDNRDGTDNNSSVNHGVEGPTDDPAILNARDRHVRALLSTLVMSTGTPMLLAGDEFGHTQNGNNNAYCVSRDVAPGAAWALDWSTRDTALTSMLARALRVRRAAPVLRQQEYFSGRDTPSGRPDLAWFDADGVEFGPERWNDDSVRTMQAWVDGSDVRISTPLEDEPFSSLVVLHSGGPAEIVLADPEWSTGSFVPVFDSAAPTGVPADQAAVAPGSTVSVAGSVVLAFRCEPGITAENR